MWETQISLIADHRSEYVELYQGQYTVSIRGANQYGYPGPKGFKSHLHMRRADSRMVSKVDQHGTTIRGGFHSRAKRILETSVFLLKTSRAYVCLGLTANDAAMRGVSGVPRLWLLLGGVSLITVGTVSLPLPCNEQCQ